MNYVKSPNSTFPSPSIHQRRFSCPPSLSVTKPTIVVVQTHMKVHARKRKMEARRAALEAGKRLAEMAGVEPDNTNTNTSEEIGEGSPNDSSKNRFFIRFLFSFLFTEKKNCRPYLSGPFEKKSKLEAEIRIKGKAIDFTSPRAISGQASRP